MANIPLNHLKTVQFFWILWKDLFHLNFNFKNFEIAFMDYLRLNLIGNYFKISFIDWKCQWFFELKLPASYEWYSRFHNNHFMQYSGWLCYFLNLKCIHWWSWLEFGSQLRFQKKVPVYILSVQFKIIKFYEFCWLFWF